MTDTTTYPWLDQHHDAIASLSDVENSLSFLAQAFDDVGNEKIADRLAGLANKVRASRLALRSSISTMLNDDLKRTQSDVAGIIKACLGANQ